MGSSFIIRILADEFLRGTVEVPERTVRRSLVIILDLAAECGVEGALLNKDIREKVVDIGGLTGGRVRVAVRDAGEANMALHGGSGLIQEFAGEGFRRDELVMVRRNPIPALAVVVGVEVLRPRLVFFICFAFLVCIVVVILHQRPRGDR
jgi:hypothetical protein